MNYTVPRAPVTGRRATTSGGSGAVSPWTIIWQSSTGAGNGRILVSVENLCTRWQRAYQEINEMGNTWRTAGRCPQVLASDRPGGAAQALRAGKTTPTARSSRPTTRNREVGRVPDGGRGDVAAHQHVLRPVDRGGHELEEAGQSTDPHSCRRGNPQGPRTKRWLTVPLAPRRSPSTGSPSPTDKTGCCRMSPFPSPRGSFLWSSVPTEAARRPSSR